MNTTEPRPADRIFATLAGAACLLLTTISIVSLTSSLFRMIWTEQYNFIPMWLAVRIASVSTTALTLAGGVGLVLGRSWGWTLAIGSICFGLLYLVFNVVSESLSTGFFLDHYLDLTFIAINALKVVALVFLFLPATRQLFGIGRSQFLFAGALMLVLAGVAVFGGILTTMVAS
jgi:hypothetical protein